MTTKTPKKKYKDGLDKETRERYEDKTKCIGIDPYDIPNQSFTRDHQCLPAITYIDIINYLVCAKSVYTMEELKAFKSLEAYNQFVNGWVNDVKSMTVNGKVLVTGRVRHSQRMNDTPLKPWIIALPSGIVESAHCNCMAGLGESCTHVGALLFFTMEASRISLEKTATQEKAYWLLPNSVDKVPYAEVQDIDFTTAQTKKKHLDCVRTGETITKRNTIKLPDVTEPSQEEISCFMDTLFKSNPRASVLSVKAKYQEHFVPDVLKDGFLPLPLVMLREEQYLNMNGEELRGKCMEIFEKLCVTEEHCKNAELVTRQQAKSKEWHSLRQGRITASNMKSVCTSSILTPAISTLNAICGTNRFTNKATQWGCSHEDVALSAYETKMKTHHENLSVSKCGLHLSTKYPHIGASPDAVVKCDCCGEGIVEVKCPYCVKDEFLMNVGSRVNFLTEGKLKVNHRYSYQVQTQLLITEKLFCDFVVWTEKDCSVERIEPNDTIQQEVVTKSQEYFVKVVLPELTGNLITRERKVFKNVLTTSTSTSSPADTNHGSDTDGDVICLCQKPYDEYDDDVIGCDSENCRFVWLHFSCVGIKKPPKGAYYCPECKPHQTKKYGKRKRQ